MNKFIEIVKEKMLPFYIIRYMIETSNPYHQFVVAIGVSGGLFKDADVKARKKLNEIYRDEQITFVSLQHHDKLLMLD